ncbi:MAG: glycosyltransferase [Lachnospiraceae bacterium]
MRKVKFAKYNRERVPQYQISTIIYEEDGVDYAEKCPLSPEAETHIQAFLGRYEKLRDTYECVQFLAPTMHKKAVRFPFVEGESVSGLLEADLTDAPKLLKNLNQFLQIIFQFQQDSMQPFEETKAFCEIFKTADERLIGKPAVKIANLDTIFDNYVISDGKWYCLDYEWVFEFPLPEEFMRFRTVYYFYNKNREVLETVISEKKLLEECGISSELYDVYRTMDDLFQQHVHGKDREYMYLAQYGKTGMTWQHFVKEKEDEHQALQEALESVQREHAQVVKYETALKHPTVAVREVGKKAGGVVKNVTHAAEENCKETAKKVLPKRVYHAASILKHAGPSAVKYALEMSKYGDNAMYVMWMKKNETDLYETHPLEYEPLISVVVPVYNVADDMLNAMIQSVRTQTYKNWELILVDDKSTMENVRRTLKTYENMPKIKVIYREENGHISRATNDGFAAAEGEFVALLDCDDLLAPNALFAMAEKLNENPNYDFIYSDEDKISEDGKERRDPFFKPDWSPDTFMSYMYTCHFSMYRKSLIDQIGGMRVGYEGSQDYDLVLRVMEQTKEIGHVPKILYHWRMRKESTANDLTAKPYIVESTIQAKKDAMQRRGISAKLECIKEVQQYRVVYDPVENPLISIIIPSKDNYEMLSQCLTSIEEQSEYRNYELIVVDNGSSVENREKYEALIRKYNGAYYYEKQEFNFSKMCNTGASHAKGELLLFLNDDIRVTEPQWLQRMAGQAGQTHTGAVGAKLLYPDSNLIQHAGVVNYEIGPGHAFHKYDDSLNLYWGRNILDYNYTIVTGACLMVDAEKFREIGGFEETLPISYNDVDLCFKLVEHGYFNVLRNDVTLYHYESVTRGLDIAPEKAARLQREAAHLYELHPNFVGYDPCYNPNLVQDRGDFSYNMSGVSVIQNAIADFTLDGMVSGKRSLRYAIDAVKKTDRFILVTGWVFDAAAKRKEEQNPIVVLRDRKGNATAFQAQIVSRADLAELYGKKGQNAGFRCKISLNDAKQKAYRIGLALNGKYINTEHGI